MRFFILLEFVMYVFIMYIVFTQILLPAARGTKMFPFFRREQKLNARIDEAQQSLYEKDLEEVAKTLESQQQPQTNEGKEK